MRDAGDRYKREQDRIFQEIEEMERLERKANQSAIAKERFERLLKSPEQSEFVFRLLQARAFKALLETTDSMDDRLAMVEEFVRAWEKTSKPDHTDLAHYRQPKCRTENVVF